MQRRTEAPTTGLSNPVSPATPLAIVGIGCRLPGGVESWQDYWQLLEEGRDAIEQTPSSRWNMQKFYAPQARPGKTHSRWGGYVRDIEQFDPQLFGISPREAAGMDPQQRMLLEVAWRAMEDAGQPVEFVAGQDVAVYVGISSFDYAVAGLSSADRGVIDAYSNTGGSSSIAANRISYCFDLRGPSVAVDTACSSSLVAVHMACESIWHGECKMALAGGVNALLMPDFYVAFSQLGVLSPDGRCKTFDARANGYVRSEGAGMVLIKPLRDAMRDGDCIYAVIRSTALNQDGRTPGLTVPSQMAQESLVRSACRRAGIHPAEIQYVEAHGTGTPVGDPIEAHALASALGADRPADQPCWIGSVKTNIGHLEAGAGIASLIKVALSLHHERIPAHLHFQSANPAIDFEGLGLRVPRQSQPWCRNPHRSRLAGINGFGYGGANAHIILEEAPVAQKQVAVKQVVAPKSGRLSETTIDHSVDSGAQAGRDGRTYDGRPHDGRYQLPVVLPISARSPEALKEAMEQWQWWLESSATDLHIAEIASFAAHRRSHLEWRAAVCGTQATELVDQLRNLVNQPQRVAMAHPRIAFVCAGQGPQWWGMGRQLMRYCPAFREVIERCGREFSKFGDWSLVEELSRSEATSQMQRTHIAQPSIFAIEVGLASVWASWGIRPDVIVGHSVGEIAAAYICGALTFEEACAVAYHRGRTMDLATSRGAMLAVGLSADELRPRIAGLEAEIAIAAINGPTSLTLSGAEHTIERLLNELTLDGIFCRRLKVEYAFHSPQMAPVREELSRALSHLRPQPTHTELISTVTGQVIDGRELNADYWWRNVRQTVLFSAAMRCLAMRDCQIALEIGPHPVLSYSIAECFQAAGKPMRSLPSLHREQDDLRCMATTLGELYCLGAKVQWPGFYTKPTRKLLIPTYPFQRTACWSESRQTRLSRLSSEVHPLLGESQHGPVPHWQARIDLRLQSYLADHRVRGTCIYPAAAMIETALCAATEIQQKPVQLDRVQLHTPCLLADGRPQWIETLYRADRRQIEMYCRATDDDQWNPLLTTTLSSLHTDEGEAYEYPPQDAESFDGPRLYAYCKQLGLEYGPQFRGVRLGWRVPGQAWIDVELPNQVEVENGNYAIFPGLLDACFHGMIAADIDFDHTLGGLYLPASIQQIRLFRRAMGHLRAHVRLISKTAKKMLADIAIFDQQNELCLSIKGFESQRVQGGGKPTETVQDLVYKSSWQSQPLDRSRTMERAQWLLFADQGSLASGLQEKLTLLGHEVFVVHAGSGFRQISSHNMVIDPQRQEDFAKLLHLCQQSKPLTRVVYLWGKDAPSSESLDCERLEQSTQLTTLAPLYFVQAWEKTGQGGNASLAIVTCQSQSADKSLEAVSIAQTPLIGLGRVIASEYAALRTKLIDLPSHDAIDELVSELLGCDPDDDDEDEVMWRDRQRWVSRFMPADGLPLPVDRAQSLNSRLRCGKTAGVEELKYRSATVGEVATGQVEIEVLATGLNFSDVMKSLDLYPGLPDGPVALGAECSGRIIRVGAGVNDFQPGDEVIAVAPGSFATHAIVDAQLVALKPKNLSHTEAAAIPIAFLTAEYALRHCAHLQAGESVLIHAASGGVGLAAIQVARSIGAEVLATAGNEEKRAFVRQQGAARAMDSRSLNFADEILEATGHNASPGVDVVLNSLSGEAISKGVSVLKTGGRFLEIGKRDIYKDAPLGLLPFKNNLSFHAIDLDQLFKQQPARMGTLLRQLVRQFESGQYQPLLTKSFVADDTRSAFRFMQQGKHIGKVAVEYQPGPSEVYPGDYAPIQFEADGSYWIAGGLGGFGLQIAKWMSERGAGHMVLSGRRQLPSQRSESLIQEFAARGTRVHLVPTDITDPTAVKKTLQFIDRELPKLRGVFHTAMVLEDKLLIDLDRATLERVLWPKVLGGWNLHHETMDYPLDWFVLFSSLSSVFGHAGQANYSAANAWLDGLAHYRRALGLPALVMNWGHLGEVGYLAEREQLGQRLERQGVLSFTVRQALECLEYAMQLKELQVSVLRMDWSIWRGLGTTRVSPRFVHLLRNQATEERSDQSQLASADQLRKASPAVRLKMVDQLIRFKAGSLLGIASDHIQSERALLEMGLDSLMAVEMRNWIEAQLEISLPIASLMRSASLRELVANVSEIVANTAERMSASPVVVESQALATTELAKDTLTAQQASDLLDQLPSLGDGEVTQLLARMLRGQ